MTYYIVVVSMPGYLPGAEPYVVSDEHAPVGVLEAIYHDVDHFAPDGEEGDAWDRVLAEVSDDCERAADLDPDAGFAYDLPDGYRIEATVHTREQLVEYGYKPGVDFD